MPIGLLIILLGAFTILIVWVMLCITAPPRTDQECGICHAVVFISLILCSILVTWLLAFGESDWKVECQLSCQCDNVNGIQAIAITHEDSVQIVNVNEKFERQFPPSQEFIVTIYKRGPYYGLYLPNNGKIYMKIEVDKSDLEAHSSTEEQQVYILCVGSSILSVPTVWRGGHYSLANCLENSRP